MDNYLIEYVCTNTNMDATELSLLLKDTFQYKAYKKGTYFAKQGELDDKIGFITDGIFAMKILKEDGTDYIKSFIKQNEFLLATFNENEANPVSILTIADSVILEAKYSDVKILFGKYPALEHLYRKEIEKETEFAYSRLEQTATLQASERYELFQKQFLKLEDLIPQYLIASYLGITPTQLSRIKKNINKCK
jgi:CRP-like cAMP-binding protein